MKNKKFVLGILGAAILIGGCAPLQPPTSVRTDQSALSSYAITKFFDVEAGVVCWLYSDNSQAGRSGISCLPVSQTKLDEPSQEKNNER